MNDPIQLPITIPDGPVTLDLRHQIETQLDALMLQGKTGVVMAIADCEGATIALGLKVGEHWKVGAEVERQWSGDVTGRVLVIGAW